jgi:hypothetical protein
MSAAEKSQYSYIDGIDSIAVIDGVVRFNLVAITSVAEGKPVTTSAGGVAMSLPSMLKLHSQLGKLIGELAQKGVLQKQSDTNAQSG